MKTITQVVQNLVKPYIDNQDQAVESNIAPVETDATSSTGSYSQGEQLILNKILYDVTAAITVGDPLEVGTNIAVAPKISAAIGGKQEQIEVSSMPTASASNVGKVLIYIGATTSTYTSGQSYQSTLEDGNYIWKPTSISSVDASDVVYDNQTSGLTATDSQAAIDELASQNQTLTSAFVNNVNQSGSKNFANYDKTVTRGTSGSIGDTLFALDLEVGDKITFVCTQDNAMVSNTRNTLQVVNRANANIKFLESNDANFHLASGLHILQFTVETAGIYNFSIWTHTLGTETTYSKFMVCDTDVYNVNPDYVPPAKTNRELTDIVTNKILLTKQSSVKVTADGTKTYATLLVEAITALRSVIGNLASNERLKPIRIGVYGVFVMPSAYEIFFDKTNTSVNINFVGNIVSANVYQTIQIQANNTGNIYIYRSDNGNIVDRGSEVPASGNFIEIIYEIYTFT